MITCKEDLYGTHVLLCDKEAAEIYVSLVNKFGISEVKIGGNGRGEDAIEVHKADWTASGWDAPFTKASSKGLDKGSRQLTLSDLKPRTKVAYVKVNGNNQGGAFWECAKDYSEGVVFTTMGSSEQLIVDSIDDLLDRYKCHNLYRRIETPMTEREAFIDEAIEHSYFTGSTETELILLENMFDSGKFKLVN